MLPINSYIVLGPGRTGSYYIVTLLKYFYLQENRIFLKTLPESEVKSIEPYTIYHSHTKEIIKLKNENTKIILSIRNVVNSALSWCIQPYIKKWHLTPRDLLNFEIVPFYLDPLKFMNYYDSAKNFYQYFTKESLEKITIIDYDDMLDSDDKLNYDAILNKLNLKITKPILDPLIVKNPGTYPQWIKNWEEIKSMSNGLEADPKSFFQN